MDGGSSDQLRPSLSASMWTLSTLSALALFAPLVLYAGRLPDPVASHWSDGRPDGQLSLAATFGALAVVWLAGHLALRHDQDRIHWNLLVVGWVWGVVAGAVWGALYTNLDAPTWAQATMPPSWASTLPFWTGLAWLGACAGLTWWSAGKKPRETSLRADPVLPKGVIAAGRRVVWTRRTNGQAAVLIGLGALGWSGVVLASELGARWATLSLVLGLFGLWTARTTVTIGLGGVRVAMDPLDWPRWRIPLSRIRSAGVAHLHPGSAGGLGLRLLPRRTLAVAVRGGDTLLLTLTTGRRVAVSVDGARQAAAVINDLVAEVAPDPRDDDPSDAGE